MLSEWAIWLQREEEEERRRKREGRRWQATRIQFKGLGNSASRCKIRYIKGCFRSLFGGVQQGLIGSELCKSLDALGISASVDQPALSLPLLLLSNRPAAHCSNALQDSHPFFFFPGEVMASSFLSLCGLPTVLGSSALQTSFLLSYER